MTGKRALVTGASGQDGFYLVAELVRRGCTVIAAAHGAADATAAVVERGVSPAAMSVTLDITDDRSIEDALHAFKPDLVFNLAALSSGQGMFEDPVSIALVNGVAVARLLEAMRLSRPAARLCQASSSEVFGLPLESPQAEDAAARPRSPYGAAKLYADHMVQLYRQRFGLYACSAILFNHESPLRRIEFVTRKVAHAAAAIKLGRQETVALGDLDARRDWGFAGDYARAMVMMLEQEHPLDCVLATGQTHSVRDLCRIAFARVGLDYRDHVQSNAAAARPAEQVQLVGDAGRARTTLGWAPTLSFEELVHAMVDADLERLRHSPSP